ncbi:MULTISPECIES: bifunctional 2-polyprenyl-6-hydroxyphenol methylase/3-demethylubiquinol 3-O-methyltransferase UbiG [unclassified Salipiger]|uniref:class I SAM-dependent methyltransferase n=1 Tax=unclassified Salipiger TaxID=2640570 RepID=UPI0013BB8130|nr:MULTISPECIES: class I SAM-dependent methyltransferase [unclassified Salipiger]NDV48436.1 class I SAM-dependent methyltransferase [Salipiger sp. PrR003]NDW35253.1 class I SAM-dependent methyltransferase [Salipiger sp. PrR007]
MVTVKEQYESYPYPERDPKDETTRLITGSPSHPLEMDHWLWRGSRDWSQPLRVLVAGGGTGDGLIQLATLLTAAKKPYKITYLDLSTASRGVAEARAKVRGLSGITFHTASLLDAADYGSFDYIDCCGVLHHLPDPKAGFAALRAALAPGGGLGFMVYAPYGRSGVYPLQEAFGALFEGLAPQERLARAQRLVADLPEGHPFAANRNLGDHHASDAGFYDLLLHGQDRSYAVPELLQTLAQTGWRLAGFTTPALYDLAQITEVPEGMDAATQMATAEKLRGTIRMHTAYAVPAAAEDTRAAPSDRKLVPHLRGVQRAALAKAVAQGRPLPVKIGGVQATLTLPKGTAPLLAGVDGRRSLSDIAQAARFDPITFGTGWAQVHKALEPWGLLLYSSLLR